MDGTPRVAPTDDLSFELDILGQQPVLQIYTQLCFCFPLPDTADHATIIDTLRTGSRRLAASFPWTAGQVVNEGASKGVAGPFRVRALEKSPRLSIKDLRGESSAPSWDELQTAEFPIRLLHEDAIAPRRTLPGGPPGDAMWLPDDAAPVFLIQVNFIRGGLVLAFNGQHASMDITGQGEVIRLYNKACRGEDFTPEELRIGNMPRSDTLPLLGSEFTPGLELENAIIKPKQPSGEDAKEEDAAPVSCSWAIFSFDPAAVAALKTKASKDVTSGFVSADDSLTAFIWQSVARARISRLGPSAPSMLTRAVDMRKFFGLPASYTGLFQNMTYSHATLAEVAEQPLGAIASRLRAELDATKLVYQTRSFATHLNNNEDKSSLSITATVNASRDVMLSSWCKCPGFELDFNLGQGLPASVRRPSFVPFESLMYLMPKRPDGEISAALSLRDEDMERLKTDAIFSQYGRYIG